MSVAIEVAGCPGAAGDWASTLAAPWAVGALYELPTLIEAAASLLSDLTAESSAYPIEPGVLSRTPTTPEVPSAPCPPLALVGHTVLAASGQAPLPALFR